MLYTDYSLLILKSAGFSRGLPAGGGSRAGPPCSRTHAGLMCRVRTGPSIFLQRAARGRRGGRKPRRAEEPRVRMAYTLYVDQQLSVVDVCQTLRISQATFYRYVALGRRAAEGLESSPGRYERRGPNMASPGPGPMCSARNCLRFHRKSLRARCARYAAPPGDAKKRDHAGAQGFSSCSLPPQVTAIAHGSIDPLLRRHPQRSGRGLAPVGK